MNNAEAITGFVAWLTTREETTKMGAKEDSSDAAARIKEFCEANGVGDVSEDWPNVFVMPPEIQRDGMICEICGKDTAFETVEYQSRNSNTKAVPIVTCPSCDTSYTDNRAEAIWSPEIEG